MRKILVSLLVAVPASLLFFTTGACSSSGADCNSTLCPNDPPPSQQAIDSCKKQQNTCSSECSAETSCFNSKVKGQVCGADGKTDATKLLAAVGMCQISMGCQTCLAK